MCRIIFIQIIMILFSFQLSATNEERIDSLKKKLLEEESDSIKVITLAEISSTYQNYDLKQALVHSKRGLVLADKLRDPYLISISLRTLGVLYYNMGEPDSARAVYKRAIDVVELAGLREELVKVLCNIAVLYSDEGNQPKALKNYLLALEYIEENKSAVNNDVASVLYHNIGNVYMQQLREDSLALYFFAKAEERFLFENHYMGLGVCYGNIAFIHLRNKNYNKAYKFNLKSINYYRLSGDSFKLADGLAAYAKCLLKMDSISKSKEIIDQAIALSKRIDSKRGVLVSKITLAEWCYAQNMSKKALAESIAASQMMRSYKFFDVKLDLYDLLAKLYEDVGVLDSSLYYYKIAQLHKDSAFNMANTTNIVSMKLKADKKIQESIENERQRKQIEQQEMQNDYLVLIINIIVVLSFLIGWFYLGKRKTLRLLERQNQRIVDSIRYAKRIQEAILLKEEDIKTFFPNSFICYQPRDIVGGDFYWMHRDGNKAVVVVADCVGHGVPGALMTMIGTTLLNEIVLEKNINNPGEILSELHKGIVLSLKQESDVKAWGEAIDASVCYFDFNSNQLKFAGAINHIYVLSGGEIEVIKGDFKSVGGIFKRKVKPDRSFDTKEKALKPGDRVYLFTDGYCDQFGGDNNEKFNTHRFKQLIINSSDKSMSYQNERIFSEIKNWMLGQPQTDDILVMGIEV